MKILTYLTYSTLGIAIVLGVVSIFYAQPAPVPTNDTVTESIDIATSTLPITPTEEVSPITTKPREEGVDVAAMLGKSTVYGGLTITPIKVLQDSRCPVDVTCIQAGTVVLEAMVDNGIDSVIQAFTLGTSLLTTEGNITLQRVEPSALSTEVLTGGEYRFYFLLQP